jgi:hypothetical protein
VGPHKCAAIALLGVPQCATCPHLALNTTPLALPFKRAYHRTHGGASVNNNPNAYSIDLPEGYYRGGDNLFYTSFVTDKGENEEKLAFEYQIVPGSFSMESGDNYSFSFDTIQGEKQVTKRFPCSCVYSISAFLEAFYKQGLPITIKPEHSRTFMAHYLKLLQSKKETLVGVPAFGWSPDHNGELGFAYAGKFFSPAGEFKARQPGTGTENYSVQGDDAIWTGLMNIILTQERPDLACIAASTFGAPLVAMTGENGFLMGLWSTESGIGKSTGLAAAQAVWAKPIVGGLNDTVNYTFAKCATLRHLPIIYDEIKGEKQTKAMVDLVFQLTRGSEKGRSGRGGEMRIVREFETLCVFASNSSLVEEVRDYTQGTDADWLRIFEMQAITKKNENPNFTSEVKERLIQLKHNYGGIGLKYAKYLGENRAKLIKVLQAYQIKLALELGADPQVHRFWLAAMATTLFGAHLANTLGFCTFPLAEMKTYMAEQYQRMKADMDTNPSDLGNDDALQNMMGVFLNEKFPRNTLLLDKTWARPGRPTKDYAKVLNAKLDGAWGAIEVQVSGDPQSIRISDSALSVWCKKNNRPKSAFTNQLKRKVGARLTGAILGSGSPKAGARENVWHIDVKGTIFEELCEYIIHHKMLPP